MIIPQPVLRLVLVLVMVGCSAPPRGVEREIDVAAPPHAPVASANAKATTDAIVHAFQLVTEESAMPGDPAKVGAAAVAALGWKSRLDWTADPKHDVDLLRGTLRALALRGELPPESVLRAARALTLAASDFHTFALTKAALQALFGLIDGEPVVQIGLVTHRLDGGHWAVSDVFTGGAAHVAGVARGDELVSVDGLAIEHGYIDFAYLLGVAPNTEARLVVKRAGADRSLVLHLTSVAGPIVDSRVIGSAGYVRIWSCTHSDDPTRDAAALVRRALEEFERKKVKGVVIDLRGNPGGFPFDVASLLVDADPLMFALTGEHGAEQPVERTKLAAWKTKWPLAAIVNDSTASGAEMIALALRDGAAATIVGRPTAGGLTFPTTEKLSTEVTISYPLSRVGDAKSKAAQDHNQITPDVAAPNPTADDYAQNRDPQLDAAIAALRPPGATGH